MSHFLDPCKFCGCCMVQFRSNWVWNNKLCVKFGSNVWPLHQSLSACTAMQCCMHAFCFSRIDQGQKFPLRASETRRKQMGISLVPKHLSAAATKGGFKLARLCATRNKSHPSPWRAWHLEGRGGKKNPSKTFPVCNLCCETSTKERGMRNRFRRDLQGSAAIVRRGRLGNPLPGKCQSVILFTVNWQDSAVIHQSSTADSC